MQGNSSPARRRTLLVCLALALVTLLVHGPGTKPLSAAPAVTLTVNSTDETVDATDGKCTLREAIHSANWDLASGNVPGECPAGSGADTIELASNATYTLSAVDNTSPALGENGLPRITSDITFNGNNATIERSAAGGTPAFRLLQIGEPTVVHLNQLTLRGGDSSANGSGIYNEGTLTLTGCTVTQNLNPNGSGGGIYNSGTLNVHSSTFSENGLGDTGMYGGAIANEGGELVITDSAFLHNAIQYAGGAVWSSGSVTIGTGVFSYNRTTVNTVTGGGAVSIEGTGTLLDSTFDHNEAEVYGGALYTEGTVMVERCTFTENTAHGSHGSGGGGAIYGSADVHTSTFYQNHAGFYADASAMRGTGTVLNSTFADNPDSDTNGAPALIGVTLQNSILLNTSCLSVTDGGGNLGSAPGNKKCASSQGNARLGPLQDNGGSTATMLPAPDSPALNLAKNALCPAVDQRGVPRPQGTKCDSGAVELEPPTAPTLTNPPDGKHLNHRRAHLTWTAGNRAAAYIVVVRQDSTQGAKVDEATLTATKYRTAQLARGHWYYWRVFSYSNVDRAPTGWWKFYVE